MNFYLGYYESANFAGAGEWYVVKADNIEDARDLAGAEADTFFYEQDSDEFTFEDEDGNEYHDEDGPYAAEQCFFEFNIEELTSHGELNFLDFLSEPGLGNSVEPINCDEAEVVAYAQKLKLELKA